MAAHRRPGKLASLAAVLCLLVAAAIGGYAVAGTRAPEAVNLAGASVASGQDMTIYACLAAGRLSHVSVAHAPKCPAKTVPVQWAAQGVMPPPSPPSGSSSPAPDPSSPAPGSSSPAPDPSSPAPGPASSPPSSPPPSSTGPGTQCVTSASSGSCGPYDYSGITASNGFNTYVMDQRVAPNAGTAETLTATSPGHWSVTANDVPYGYTGVQMFDAVQQLTNDWNGSGWGNCGTCTDTPLNSLTSLTVSYAETSPSDANSIYEFAPDVWNDNYGSDVMFWADTSPRRCTDNGMSAGNIIGQAVLGGQNWTVYRYGGVGSEIIFILDGTASTDPVSTGTCARQASGTIDILGGYRWLASHGIMTTVGSISQLNTGWEITSADKTTFTVSSYSIDARV